MAAQSSRRPAESPGKEPAALEPSDGPDQLAVEDDLTVGPDFYETSRRYPQRPRSRRRLLLAAAAVVVVIASLAVAWPYLSSGIGKGLRNQPLNQENKHAPGESATALQDQVPATADVQGGDMTPDGSAEPLPGGSDAGSVPAGASNQEGTAGGDLTDGEEAREQVQSTASTSDEGTGAIESTTEREVAALAVATADPPQTRSSGNPSSSTPSQSETRGSGQAVAREVELPIDRPDDAQRVAPSDSPPPPPPSSGFGVHVASFGELARAEAFISRLNKLGYPAFFLKKVIGNETWNRVYVGPFMERQQAQRYSRNLQEQGLAEYYLVTKFGDG
jgi:cell division septation protein DedD